MLPQQENRERWGHQLLWGSGEVILVLKGELEFSRKKRRIVYSRDLEDEQMIVFSGKRAACREGLAGPRR